jgi:hypothetical protein
MHKLSNQLAIEAGKDLFVENASLMLQKDLNRWVCKKKIVTQ